MARLHNHWSGFLMHESGMGRVCPCGSGQVLAACCVRYHLGEKAVTAEALMRSRYAAYVLGNIEYIRDTWHPDTCPEHFTGDSTKWLGLRVLHCSSGQAGDCEGTVEFVAAFYESGKVKGLHEVSRFVQSNGHWFYFDGKPRIEVLGRNDPCPCGSGRKLKQCCGSRIGTNYA